MYHVTTCSEIYLLVFTCIIPKYGMCLINNLSEYLANFAAVSPHLVDTSTKGESVVMVELVPWCLHCHGRAGPSWPQLLMPHLWRIIWAGCHPEPSSTGKHRPCNPHIIQVPSDECWECCCGASNISCCCHKLAVISRCRHVEIIISTHSERADDSVNCYNGI